MMKAKTERHKMEGHSRCYEKEESHEQLQQRAVALLTERSELLEAAKFKPKKQWKERAGEGYIARDDIG